MAGVSSATVSRVLNNPNYHCSSEEVRERIWNIAMSLNYVPNAAARNLKLGIKDGEEKTYYVNVLMTRTGQEDTDPFFSELLRVIESEIHRHLCILAKVWYMPFFSDDKKCNDANLDHIIRDMFAETDGRSDGLIIIGKCNAKVLRKLQHRCKCIVSVNRNSTNYEVDEVICDGEKIAAMAVDYLISLGHREIGYIGGCRNEARYRGFIRTLQKNHLDLEPSYVIETKQTEVEGYTAMETLLRSEYLPTGIYCANDITALGVLKCISKHKTLRYTPSIISSDDIEQAQFAKPMLTTVRLPKEEMGKFALYLLVDRMKGGHESVVRTELEGKLIVRSSCATLDGGWYDYMI